MASSINEPAQASSSNGTSYSGLSHPPEASRKNTTETATAIDSAASLPSPAQGRLLSLDVYRGLIMVTLAFHGFGLFATAGNHLKSEESPFWQEMRYQFNHVEWTGCGYWDLIQPSFMFMVGAAMAFSGAKRSKMGQSFSRMLGHAVWRSIVLIMLGIFLISNGRKSTDWSLMNVLTQIGLGYTFLFLLWRTSFQVRIIMAAAILIGTYLAFVLYPYAGIDLEKGAPQLGVKKAWADENLTGIAPAWHKNANVGHALDVWLLNIPFVLQTEIKMWQPSPTWEFVKTFLVALPTAEPFHYNSGGYQTINFIPSLVTMLFGVMCGDLLRSSRTPSRKVLILLAVGLAGVIVGEALDWAGICPLVKRIWTPSWTIFSTGWCCLILGGLYLLIDVMKVRFWTYFLVVVGVNSLAIYCMHILLNRWVRDTWKTHFGPDTFKLWNIFQSWDSTRDWGVMYEPTIQAVMVGMVFWLVCWWMYRNKIYVRI